MVEAQLKSPTGEREYMKVLSKFFEDRSDSLFSVLPTDRISYTTEDRDVLFKAFPNIPSKTIKNAIDNTYYGDIKKFNFIAPQDPSTVLILCIIRYYFLKNDKKKKELTSLYMAFSGKMYPSIHYKSFPIVPVDYVMEYVINNNVNNKFDISSKGSLYAAMKSKTYTWTAAYTKRFKDFDDEDVVYLILQLRSRISAFMKNIASLYYKAYKNKDYIVYNSDNENPEDASDYHIANSDSFVAQKIIEKTISFISTSDVQYKICKMCANKSVKTDELKSIIEAILNSKDNIALVRDVVSIMVFTYFETSKDKDVLTMDFIVDATSPKPNSKDPHIVRMKSIISLWLEKDSVMYRKRKHRLATKNDYFRAVQMYFAMSIFMANKG